MRKLELILSEIPDDLSVASPRTHSVSRSISPYLVEPDLIVQTIHDMKEQLNSDLLKASALKP